MTYVERAIEYAKAAQGSDTHGKWSQLACKRFLDDLKRAEQDDCKFYFSEWHATDVCEFVEKMPHIKGKWETRELRLHDSQVFFAVNLFGFMKKENDTRRFTNGLWCSARKNGKSTFAAAIGLYCQFVEDENGADIISAAPTGKQARIIFDVAKAMVNKEPDLKDYYSAEVYANSIAGFENLSSFIPVNSKADSLDGLNPYLVLVDEVHAHKSPDLINVLKSADGAREDVLFLFVTTEGHLLANSPWPDIRMFCQQALSGARPKEETDHFMGIIFSIDDDDDEFDSTKWIKANPIMEVNPILMSKIKEAAIEAQAMPSKMAEFRIKRLNRPSAAAEAHVDLRQFEQNKTVLPLDELEGYPCWLSLDLSATRDLTSLRMLWLVGDEYHTHGWRFLPKNGIHQQTASGGDIYAGWKEQGLIIETEGKTVNHAVITEKIIELYKRFQPAKVCADTWNATEIIRVLADEHDIEVTEFRQGAKSYHPAIKKFDEVYYSGSLYHGCDPVLVWNAGNLVIRYDQNMNQSPDKKNSANKIDDIVTLLMCFGMSLEYEPVQTFDDVMTNRISMTL